MTFPNEQVLFWTFSTIAQALAALMALSAMVAFYVLGKNNSVLDDSRDKLISWHRGGWSGIDLDTRLDLGDLDLSGQDGRDLLDKAIEHAVDDDMRSNCELWRYKVDRALLGTRRVRKGLKRWVACGSVAICLSLLSLPFVPFMVRTHISRIASIVWLTILLLMCGFTVVVVAFEFVRWMEFTYEFS